MSPRNSFLLAERAKPFRYALQDNFSSVRRERDPYRVTRVGPILLVQHFDSGTVPLFQHLGGRSSSNDDAMEVAQEVRGLPDESKLGQLSRWAIRSHRFAVSHSSRCLFYLLQDR